MKTTTLSDKVYNNPFLFSRAASLPDNVYEKDQVKVMLRVFWDPFDPANIFPGHDFSTSARKIDSTLTTTVKINSSVN
jgi:hypothetical protein